MSKTRVLKEKIQRVHRADILNFGRLAQAALEIEAARSSIAPSNKSLRSFNCPIYISRVFWLASTIFNAAPLFFSAYYSRYIPWYLNFMIMQ